MFYVINCGQMQNKLALKSTNVKEGIHISGCRLQQ